MLAPDSLPELRVSQPGEEEGRARADSDSSESGKEDGVVGEEKRKRNYKWRTEIRDGVKYNVFDKVVVGKTEKVEANQVVEQDADDLKSPRWCGMGRGPASCLLILLATVTILLALSFYLLARLYERGGAELRAGGGAGQSGQLLRPTTPTTQQQTFFPAA